MGTSKSIRRRLISSVDHCHLHNYTLKCVLTCGMNAAGFAKLSTFEDGDTDTDTDTDINAGWIKSHTFDRQHAKNSVGFYYPAAMQQISVLLYLYFVIVISAISWIGIGVGKLMPVSPIPVSPIPISVSLQTMANSIEVKIIIMYIIYYAGVHS